MKVFIGDYPEGDDKRVIDVSIDDYDLWSMDNTLAHIIAPMLKMLKATKHSAALVDDEYVPEHLRSTASPAKENEWDIDDNHFKRWDYVLDEMIWAMTQIIDNDNDGQFYDTSHINEEADLIDQLAQIKCDNEGLKKHHERITNGTKLFGIFFSNLWD